MNYTERGLVCGSCFSAAEAKWRRAERKAMDRSTGGSATSVFGSDVDKAFKPLKIKKKYVDEDGIERTEVAPPGSSCPLAPLPPLLLTVGGSSPSRPADCRRFEPVTAC